MKNLPPKGAGGGVGRPLAQEHPAGVGIGGNGQRGLWRIDHLS